MRRRRTTRPFACVIGEIDILRALGLAGIPCALVAHKGDFARASRSARITIDLPSDWNAPELVERLVAWAATRDEAPVLFYDGDWDLLMVSQHRDRLSEAFRFVVPEHELVLDVVDKSRFVRLAAQHDLPVPRAAELTPDSTPSDIDLRFPVVVKPLTRHHDTWRPLSQAKAIQVDSATELVTMWPRLAALDMHALVQELVPGPERLIESYHVYVDGSGAIAGEFTGRKIRTYPLMHGYSTALETSDARDILQLGRDIVTRIGLRGGVAKLDFKRHPETGRPMLLEINPRFNLWHHLGAKAGVNLAHLVYADLTGEPRPAPATARPGVRWVNASSDFRAARAEGIPLGQWLPWVLGCEAKHGIAWNDPLPFFVGMLELAGRRWRRRRIRPVGVP